MTSPHRGRPDTAVVGAGPAGLAGGPDLIAADAETDTEVLRTAPDGTHVVARAVR